MQIGQQSELRTNGRSLVGLQQLLQFARVNDPLGSENRSWVKIGRRVNDLPTI